MRSASTKPTTERSVTQVSRVAVKIGDDYYTFENAVTLAPGATDEEIAAAIDTGSRIYLMQRAALDAQVAELRAAPPAASIRRPTRKQIDYLGQLRSQVSNATIAAVYREFGITAPEPQTFDDARALIDRFKAIINGVADDPAAVLAGERSQEQPAEEVTEDLPF